MNVTKCDRCGAYLDKADVDTPKMGYALSANFNEPYHKLDICYECYSELLKWVQEYKVGGDK